MITTERIQYDINLIIEHYKELNIDCIMLGGSCSWGCINPRDVDYVVYCNNITHTEHQHIKSFERPHIHIILVPTHNRFGKNAWQSWQIAEMYLALMQYNPQLILYGTPPDANCPIDCLVNAKTFMLKDLQECICRQQIAKHCYIYLMWYYAWHNACITEPQKRKLQEWHDLHFTIDDLTLLYNKIQEITLC